MNNIIRFIVLKSLIEIFYNMMNMNGFQIYNFIMGEKNLKLNMLYIYFNLMCIY